MLESDNCYYKIFMFVVFVEFFYIIIIMYICWVLLMCDLLCIIIINKFKWLYIYWLVLRFECLNIVKYKGWNV